jgi:DNA-binding transcriptional LysR family regulator
MVRHTMPDRRNVTLTICVHAVTQLSRVSDTSPRSVMLGASKGLQNVEDLMHCTLLHWDMSELSPYSATRRWMSWQGWLERAGARQFDHHDNITFSDYNLLVQSAVAGHGVIVGSLPVLSGLISTGLLVNPLGETVDTDVGYDLVTTPQALERNEAKSFVKWMLQERLKSADGERQTSGGNVVSDRAII